MAGYQPIEAHSPYRPIPPRKQHDKETEDILYEWGKEVEKDMLKKAQCEEDSQRLHEITLALIAQLPFLSEAMESIDELPIIAKRILDAEKEQFK
jgi:hypothetical protein